MTETSHSTFSTNIIINITKKKKKKNYHPNYQYQNKQKISGLTPEQRFFLAYGYAWMVNIKPEALANQLLTDVHSPAKFRINGPLQNNPDFHNAFNIKPGSKMRRPDNLKVEIW